MKSIHMNEARENLEYDINENLDMLMHSEGINEFLSNLLDNGREELYVDALEDYDCILRNARDNIVIVANFLLVQPKQIRNLKQYRNLAALLVEYIDYYYAACDAMCMLDITTEYGDIDNAIWNSWFDHYDLDDNRYDSGCLGRKLITMYNIIY